MKTIASIESPSLMGAFFSCTHTRIDERIDAAVENHPAMQQNSLPVTLSYVFGYNT
jgi:hypothetical protein